jgi:hypothetical protein
MIMTAESLKKKQITKSPKNLLPRTARANKIIELKQDNPALTTREIATLTECDHSNVVRVLQRYGIVQEEVNEYKNKRADILAGLQHRLLSSITDADVQKAPLGSRVLAACQIYDKERLERGQSTENIAQIHGDIAKIKAAMQNKSDGSQCD